MNLRVVAAGVLLVVVAGCLGASTGGDATEPEFEAYVFDHAGHDSPAVEGGVEYPADAHGPRSNYVTLVTSEADADRFNQSVLDEGAASFVANTSFDESYLVVIQEFPASSVPDYRVESVERTGDTLQVRINDSSEIATADITVETVLVRVHGTPPEGVEVTTEEGDSFDSTAGVVTSTATTTRTTTTPSLPYAADDPAANVEEPRDLRVENRVNDTVGYRLSVTYSETPACRNETPPCGMPNVDVEVLNRLEKLPEGRILTVTDVAARTGTYELRVEAEVPAGDGSRRTITESFDWRVDEQHGDAVVVITADDVRLTYESVANATGE